MNYKINKYYNIAKEECELTILMPCLNEAETLEICIKKALKFLNDNKVNGEVLIADNGSTDGSPNIAIKSGANVVHVPEKGYGSALIGGTKAARGKYIIMGDADDSYDFLNLMPFLEKLREGYDLVMGNRFKGGIAKGAMPPLHKYLGNPVLSSIGRIFYSSSIGDFHCGLRGYNKESFLALNLNTPGMEYASEMVVKATLNKFKITEVPTTLSPDGRSRPPHLRSWHDGWRHLRFLLLYSPKWLFFYPGLFLIILGTISTIVLSIEPISINNVVFDINTLLYSAGAVLIGFQVVIFALITNIYAINSKYIPVPDKLMTRLNRFTVERGLVLGLLMFLFGFILAIVSVVLWKQNNFGNLDPRFTMRITIPSFILMVCGIEFIFSSFLMGVLNIKVTPNLDANVEPKKVKIKNVPAIQKTNYLNQ